MADEKVLLVRLGSDLYAIPIGVIEEVLPALPVESMPQCPEFIRGVIFMRGHLIPVVRAAERLGITTHQPAEDPNIVCLKVGKRLIGVEFDEAMDLMDLDPKPMLSSGEMGVRKGFFKGVVEHNGRLIRILDPEKLTSPEEIQLWMGPGLE